MTTDVKLPQMGESIYEGTITKWFKKEGDHISKDEPLYELSTDKVDSEIPSPVSGKLVKIVVGPGKKVPIQTVIAQVEEGNGEKGAAAVPEAPAPAEKDAAKQTPAPPAKEAAKPAAAAPVVEAAPVAEEGERQFASPLVRKMAKDEGIDLSQIRGTGPQGRITKEDVTAYLDRRKGGEAAPPAPPAAQAPAPAAAPSVAGPRQAVEPMSPMRQRIAEHMVMSKRTSAHVYSLFEADMSNVVALREEEKEEYEALYGTKLTFTPFFAAAAMQAIKEFPVVNSSVDGTNVVLKRDINIGIAVALPDGLIVPVVHKADEKSFLGLCRAINDLAERSRTKKLKVEDVQGGTFTITNPGVYGGLFGLAIINQPQVAIMGVGGIEKRPIVIGDAIAVRPMCYISLSYDHRVIDGAIADQFLAKVKQTLQEWNLPIK